MKSILFAVALGLATPAAAQAPADTAPTRLVFEEVVTMGPTQIIGDTPLGRRQRMPITGGTFKGEKLAGRVLPGADWQLVRADGMITINAEYMIETDDKVQIHVHNVGIVRLPKKDGDKFYMWAAPTFEAPIGRYDWLNQAIFVSKVEAAGDKDHPAARILIYQVD